MKSSAVKLTEFSWLPKNKSRGGNADCYLTHTLISVKPGFIATTVNSNDLYQKQKWSPDNCNQIIQIMKPMQVNCAFCSSSLVINWLGVKVKNAEIVCVLNVYFNAFISKLQIWNRSKYFSIWKYSSKRFNWKAAQI